MKLGNDSKKLNDETFKNRNYVQVKRQKSKVNGNGKGKKLVKKHYESSQFTVERISYFVS